MKLGVTLLGLGAAGLVLRGVAETFIPPYWFPDLGLLVVIGVGLRCPGAIGMLVCAGLGYAADVLSGSLFGQHALLWILTFGFTRLANRQLDLVRFTPLAMFAGVVTLVNGLGLVAVSRFFRGDLLLGGDFAVELVAQTLSNAVCAPLVGSLLTVIVTRFGEDEAARRSIDFDSRRRTT